MYWVSTCVPAGVARACISSQSFLHIMHTGVTSVLVGVVGVCILSQSFLHIAHTGVVSHHSVTTDVPSGLLLLQIFHHNMCT